MLIRIWRFVTLVLAALLVGMTFCHLLEMPAKLRYSASMYLTLHRTLYVAFGPPNIGVFVEMGAILSSAVLVLLVRRRAGFWPTLIGAACLLMGLVTYFAQVEPANAALKMMAVEAPPENWAQWRDQWEYGHTLHFAFDFLGFCALTWSVLSRSPAVVDGPSRRLPSYDSVSARPS
jgi:hypothetical protein